ncbi:MAG: hypothetical protein QXR58_00450 [Candidatus Micrarchaeaceae archaeon]
MVLVFEEVDGKPLFPRAEKILEEVRGFYRSTTGKDAPMPKLRAYFNPDEGSMFHINLSRNPSENLKTIGFFSPEYSNEIFIRHSVLLRSEVNPGSYELLEFVIAHEFYHFVRNSIIKEKGLPGKQSPKWVEEASANLFGSAFVTRSLPEPQRSQNIISRVLGNNSNGVLPYMLMRSQLRKDEDVDLGKESFGRHKASALIASIFINNNFDLPNTILETLELGVDSHINLHIENLKGSNAGNVIKVLSSTYQKRILESVLAATVTSSLIFEVLHSSFSSENGVFTALPISLVFGASLFNLIMGYLSESAASSK